MGTWTPGPGATSGDDVFIGDAALDVADGGAGNDRLEGGGARDVLTGGAGSDTLLGGEGDDSLYFDVDDLTGGQVRGGAGLDWILNTTTDLGVVVPTINMALLEAEAYNGNGAAETIDASGVTSWTVLYGNGGNDTFLGGAGADFMYGGDGDDTMTGNGGADAFDGGTGNDTVTYASAATAAIVDLSGSTTNSGAAFGDSFTSIETVIGSAYGDRLTGGTGNDRLEGGGARDVLTGGAGSDTLLGGEGDDSIYFDVDDLTGGQVRGGAGHDWILNTTTDLGVVVPTINMALLEAEAYNGNGAAETIDASGVATWTVLYGNGGNDTFVGGSGVDFMYGGDGDDVMTGNGGADVFNGGAGNDTVTYASAATAAVVDLSGSTANSGAAIGDSFTSIETVIGSAHGDRLTGGTGNDRLEGGGARDILTGGAGADTLLGGEGDDSLYFDVDDLTGGLVRGGAGLDWILNTTTDLNVVVPTINMALLEAEAYNGNGAAETIDASGVTSWTVLYGNGGNDTIIGGSATDFMYGGDGDDAMTANGGADVLEGGAGNDYMDGSTGDDRLTGGAGNDLMRGGDGADIMDGGADADRLEGGAGNDDMTGGDGEDTLIGGSGNDLLKGNAGNDYLEGGEGADQIQGGDGLDTASYASSAAAVTAYLDGTASSGGDAQGDTFTGVENLTGSSYNDSLYGTADVANRLSGGDGDDYLNGLSGDDVLIGGLGADWLVGGVGNNFMEGGAGADRIDGGAGYDTVTYANSSAAVTVHLDGSLVTGGDAAGDVLTEIENLFGSAFNDTLYGANDAPNRIFGGGGNDYIDGLSGQDALAGDAGDDQIFGGDGDDTLEGGAGADTLSGGNGFDTASYTYSGAAVTVYLDGTVGVGGDAAGDVLSGIENADGSIYNDYIYGVDGVANRIDGGAGNDYLDGRSGDDILLGSLGVDTLIGGDGNDTLDGGVGADIINGGTGLDTVTYQRSTAAVTVYLDGTANTGGDAEGDALTDIENVTGSSFGDNIYGSSGANGLTGGWGNDVIDGREGDDTLIGNGGEDRLIGGAGNDSLTGGDDSDTFVMSAGGGQDRVLDFNTAQDRFDLGGDVWSSVSVADLDADGTADDTLLSYSGGSMSILNVTGLTLAQWNALVGS